MSNKIKVGVIDSGVDMQDPIIKLFNVSDIYYDNGEFKEGYRGKLNSHGTEIIKILLREAPGIDIISIRTLREDNKCIMSDIIEAIRYCIKSEVEVINLSLGSCTASSARLIQLEDICSEAISKGIAIFAADNNIPGKISYPANFQSVIGAASPEEAKEYCYVRYKDKVVEFADSYVYIPDATRCKIRRGTSYLSPLLAGIFCRFAENRSINEECMTEFMNFLEQFGKKENILKIFFDKSSLEERFSLNGKKVLFFADYMDLNNMNLYEMYNQNADVHLCIDDIYGKKETVIEEYLKGIDVFFIGILSDDFIRDNRKYIEKLITILVRQNVHTIMVFPLVSTYNRMCLTAGSESKIKAIYK